jgi:flavorubredoxin
MKPRQIRPGIHAVGAIDWDRRLFDALIPLPDGTSYNSYLVNGSEKTVLIDTVDPTMEHELWHHLDDLNCQRLDYVVANHAEQDHSGMLLRVLEKYPQAKVLCTPRCKGMLMDFLLIPEDRIMTVEDKQTISLGDRTLEFIHAAWVHWPETMLTYLKEERILFPCDLFGSHLATTDLYVTDEGQVYESAKRYFAEIMMPFRANIEKHLERLKGYQIDIIGPSHGPMYNKPAFIMDAYRGWVLDKPKNEVVLPYISMHGSTKVMVEYLVGALADKGVTVKQFNLEATDLGPHPNVAHAAFLANAIRPKLQFVSIIGSYGWGSKAVEQLSAMIPNLKVEVLAPVYCKGLPKAPDLKALDALAEAIAQKHKERGFV